MAVIDEPSVFLSYAHRDGRTVDALERGLADAGIRVWRDIPKIEVGDQWRDTIGSAIQSSRALVLALSRSSANSSEVYREVALASEEGVPILPLHIEPMTEPLPSRLRLLLAEIHFVELHRDFEAGLATTIKAIDKRAQAKARIGALPSDFPSLEARGHAKVSKLASECEQRLAEGRFDIRTLLQLGQYYLYLGRYPEARDRLRTAVRTDPTSAPAAYLLALAAVAGRRPGASTKREAEGISQLLERAVSLDPEPGHYDYLAALVKVDYYEGHGLLVPPPSVEELTERLTTKNLDAGELARIDSTSQIEPEVRARALGYDR